MSLLDRLLKTYQDRRNDYEAWAKEVEAEIAERNELNDLCARLTDELNEAKEELLWYQLHSFKRLERQAIKQGLELRELDPSPEPSKNWISIKNPKTGTVELVEAPEKKK